MKDLTEKLKSFKVLFLDADGVFFDGQETRGVFKDEVLIFKERSYQDGQGISFLRELGIRIVFVTGEGEPLQSIVEKINALPSVKDGRWVKVEIFTKQNSKGAKLDAIKKWLSENNFSLDNSAYIGDDINDFEPIVEIKKEGGLIICPANSTRVVLSLADIITKKSGGHGAIREFVEMVLDARGIDEKNFPPA